jgi:putative intracellular protease/amidase
MNRAIAFLQPGWADWEAGQVLPLLRQDGGCEIRIATVDGAPQTSIGGVRAAADAAFAEVGAGDADIYLLIGSDAWCAFQDERYFGVLRDALARGAVVGAICAGTVAAARAGLFGAAAHTSNGREFLAQLAPGYAGADRYLDVPHAVRDGRLVSASGVAPVTFAAEVMAAALPGHQPVVEEYRALMSREWLPRAQGS